MTFDQWLAASPYRHEAGGVHESLWRQVWDAAVERCAKIAEQTHAELDLKFSPEGCTDSALVVADRIRAIEGKP